MVEYIKCSLLIVTLCNSRTCKFSDITRGYTKSLGLIKSNLMFEYTTVRQDFQVVNGDFPIPVGAILGEDFLSRYKCSIDYEKSRLIIRKEDGTIIIPFETELRHGI